MGGVQAFCTGDKDCNLTKLPAVSGCKSHFSAHLPSETYCHVETGSCADCIYDNISHEEATRDFFLQPWKSKSFSDTSECRKCDAVKSQHQGVFEFLILIG